MSSDDATMPCNFLFSHEVRERYYHVDGHAVKARRESMRISYREMASMCGWSPTRQRDIERKKKQLLGEGQTMLLASALRIKLVRPTS